MLYLLTSRSLIRSAKALFQNTGGIYRIQGLGPNSFGDFYSACHTPPTTTQCMRCAQKRLAAWLVRNKTHASGQLSAEGLIPCVTGYQCRSTSQVHRKPCSKRGIPRGHHLLWDLGCWAVYLYSLSLGSQVISATLSFKPTAFPIGHENPFLAIFLIL